MIIIDASVALKWFFREEEGSERALAVLLDLQEKPAQYMVPELFFVQMLSVLSRAESRLDQLKEHIFTLEELGIARLAHGHELLEKACEYTLSYRLSAYDALYAACAAVTDGVWVTADREAHGKIASLGISRLL